MAILQGFAKHHGRRGGLWRGGGLRQNLGAAALPPPHIYRGKGDGGRPPQIQSEEGAAARGVALPPKARGAPPLRVPQTPRRMGPGREGAQPTKGLVPLHIQPIGPFGAGGPSWWTPGTLRWSRYITGDARNTSGVQILTSYISFFTSGPFRNSSWHPSFIRDSEQHSVTTYILSL